MPLLTEKGLEIGVCVGGGVGWGVRNKREGCGGVGRPASISSEADVTCSEKQDTLFMWNEGEHFQDKEISKEASPPPSKPLRQ